MILYECAARKNFKKITGIVMILVSIAALMFLIPSVFREMPYRWMLQLLGFACLSAIIYITVKYITKSYAYAIEKKKDGTLDLIVVELLSSGKRKLTVCRISLKNVEQVYILDKRNDTDKIKSQRLLESARAEKRSVFNYYQDMAPSSMCYVLATECDEPLMIKLAPDEKLFEYLSGQTAAPSAE